MSSAKNVSSNCAVSPHTSPITGGLLRHSVDDDPKEQWRGDTSLPYSRPQMQPLALLPVVLHTTLIVCIHVFQDVDHLCREAVCPQYYREGGTVNSIKGLFTVNVVDVEGLDPFQ